MNNQQQVDKKRHGSKIMRSKSLNVTATSLISSFFFSRNSGASMKRKKEKRERESGTRRDGERERSVKEKRMEFFFSATAIEIESSRE
jgi:hypothetical protein